MIRNSYFVGQSYIYIYKVSLRQGRVKLVGFLKTNWCCSRALKFTISTLLLPVPTCTRSNVERARHFQRARSTRFRVLSQDGSIDPEDSLVFAVQIEGTLVLDYLKTSLPSFLKFKSRVPTLPNWIACISCQFLSSVFFFFYRWFP